MRGARGGDAAHGALVAHARAAALGPALGALVQALLLVVLGHILLASAAVLVRLVARAQALPARRLRACLGARLDGRLAGELSSRRRRGVAGGRA